MSFSSLFFILVFLPASLILYYVFPARLRRIPLIAVSLLFFSWSNPVYLVFLLLSLAFNYVGGLQIAFYKGNDRPRLAKASLIVTVTADILRLVFFKYLAFLISNLNLIPGISLSAPEIRAPIGLMFYIPTVLSYVFDIYYGRAAAEKNVLNYLTYATFFPKLLSGPDGRIIQQRANLVQAGAVIPRIDQHGPCVQCILVLFPGKRHTERDRVPGRLPGQQHGGRERFDHASRLHRKQLRPGERIRKPIVRPRTDQDRA